jgi:hypothetical protein
MIEALREAVRYFTERRLLAGVVFWVLFAVVAVALQGVRWEENWERVMMIIGMTPYPDQHPYYQYTFTAMPPHYVLTAFFARMFPAPALICGFWNAVFLACATVPVYLLATLATGRSIWGHFTAFLMLLNILANFGPYYPIDVWPARNTLGQFGFGLALCILFLFAGRKRRTAFLLTGLMPAIHIGIFPASLAFAGMYGIWTGVRYGKKELIALTGWLSCGLAIAAAWWAWRHYAYAPPPVTDPPWNAPGNWHEIWKRYTWTHDVHRGFPRFGPPGHIFAMGGTALLTGAAAVRLEMRRRRFPGPFTWYLIFACCAGGIAAGCGLVNFLSGEETPFLIIAWIPYRLLNFVPVLAVVLIAGLLGSDAHIRNRQPGFTLAVIAALLVLAQPVLYHMLPGIIQQRYTGAPENLTWLLAGFGAGTAFISLHGDRHFRRCWLLMASAAFVCFACYHQFGAAVILAGALAALGLPWIYRVTGCAGKNHAIMPALLTVLLLTGMAGILFNQWRHRDHLPGDPFDAKVTRYLAEKGEENAMILGPHHIIHLQERIGHPFLVTYETAHLLSYTPHTAPALAAMYEEIFDIRFGGIWSWRLDAWEQHSTEKWRELGARWGFSHVLCPHGYSLDLPAVLAGENWTLYAVPEDKETAEK